MARIFVVTLPLMLFFILSLKASTSLLPHIAHAQKLSHRKNRQNPDQKSSMSEASLTYEQQFTVSPNTLRIPKRCHRNPDNKTNVTCEANVHLIRPDNIIKEWQHQQATNKKIILTMEDMGLDAVKARLITVRHLSRKTLPAGTVTGTFERFSRQVYRYRFREEKAEQKDEILATPEHRFYSATRKAYVPLSTLNDRDRLITANGHSVKLVCPKNQHDHCGEVLAGHPLRLVHNLEVAMDHVYFAGHQHLLVHNGYFYRCVECNVNRKERHHFTKKHRKAHRVEIHYMCAYCNFKTTGLQRLKSHETQWHQTLTRCPECSIDFPSLKDFKQHKKATHRWIPNLIDCEFCNKLVSEKSYERHVNDYHSPVVFTMSPDTFGYHLPEALVATPHEQSDTVTLGPVETLYKQQEDFDYPPKVTDPELQSLLDEIFSQ